MKAVFLDFGSLAADGLDSSPLLDALPGIELHDNTPDALVPERIADAGFVLTNKSRLDAGVLAGARSLHYIGLAATGSDNVDTGYAKSRGIAVTNIRSYCTQSVVEHVFGMLLMLTRNLHRYDADVRAGRWQTSQHFSLLSHPIRELSALTLGIVGYGELGRAVAQFAEALGMRVIVSRRPGVETDRRDGRLPLEELLGTADVVSLHCPLNDSTAGLISDRQFETMKDDSILVNTARGALVDSRALVVALARGQIGAAAIDVLDGEPPSGSDPLLHYDGDNLILTPHIAWGSARARQNALDELAANVRAYRDGVERNRIA